MKPTDKYKFWPERAVKKQAKHLIENCSEMDLCVHKINKYLIFKFLFWEVVNSEKLKIDCFETEEEALNHCLDKYAGSKIPEQLKLPKTEHHDFNRKTRIHLKDTFRRKIY